jgi:hypothetical protein
LRNGEVASSRWPPGPAADGRRARAWSRHCIPSANSRGRHRTFLEVHLAKSRRVRLAGASLPHIIATSYLTHEPIASFSPQAELRLRWPALLSPGPGGGPADGADGARSAFRLGGDAAANARRAAAKGAREPARRAHRLGRAAGEASDYTDNLPSQCLHPVGHWFEVPNLLRNGTSEPSAARAAHSFAFDAAQHRHRRRGRGSNVYSACISPAARALTFEVITRRLDDRGGGLARVERPPRLVEGLAMPREEDEFHLSYYNTLTTWIDIDRLLQVFGLSRTDLGDAEKVAAAVREVGRADADLHHAQRREKAMGTWAGRYLPRGPVRKALGRHDGVARSRLRLRRRPPRPRASSSRIKHNSTDGFAIGRRRTWNRSVILGSSMRRIACASGLNPGAPDLRSTKRKTSNCHHQVTAR